MAHIMTLALDPESRDLVIGEDGGMQCVYDGEAIAQNIRNNLLTWKGEFPLNTRHGTAWDRLAGRPRSEAEGEADDVVRASVFQEPYLQEIEDLNIAMDGRSLGVNFSGTLYDGTAVRVEVTSDG